MLGTGKFMVLVINVIIGTYTFLTGLHVELAQQGHLQLLAKNAGGFSSR